MPMNRSLFYLILICVTPSQSLDISINPQDKKPLLWFKSSLHDPSQSLSNWVGFNCSTWNGITCDNTTGRVISINLTSMNLSGQVHPNFCKLLYLNKADFSHNHFTCPLPVCFGNLLNLRVINLSHNKFRGGIPDSFMRFKLLTELVLNENPLLGGSLPLWIGNFSANLERVNLGFCSFSGGIPESLLYLKSLKYLDLENNLLSGNLVVFQQAVRLSQVTKVKMTMIPGVIHDLLVKDDDQSLPSTSIQLNLADGNQLISHFNNRHTIGEICAFIDASRPGRR